MPIESLSYLEATFYGCIQGLTEFLPVSSSGHLALAHQLGLGHIDDDQMRPFSVLLHVATLFAVLWAFRREVLRAFSQLNKTAVTNASVSIVPAIVFGLSCSGLIGLIEGNMLFLGMSFSLTAVLLLLTDRILFKRAAREAAALASTAQSPEARKKTEDIIAREQLVENSAELEAELSSLRLKQALWVGFGQAMALFPGVSRSGSSLCAGVIAGVETRVAFTYSFLVGIPLIAGAAAHEFLLTDDFAPMIAAIGWGPLLWSMCCAVISGLAAIALLRFVITKRCLSLFGIYCGLLAGMCLVFAISA